MNIEQIKRKLGEEFSRDADFLNSIIETLHLPKESILLDVGTGRGVMAILLALHGYKVITGEPEGVNWADWRSSAKKVEVEKWITFMPINAEKLSFNENFFDAIFLYTSFHHIDNKKRAINELIRITKSKGLLVIIEFTEKGVEKVRKRYRNHQDAVDPQVYTRNLRITPKIIESTFLNAYVYSKKVP